jgi:hypothetical protein
LLQWAGTATGSRSLCQTPSTQHCHSSLVSDSSASSIHVQSLGHEGHEGLGSGQRQKFELLCLCCVSRLLGVATPVTQGP